MYTHKSVVGYTRRRHGLPPTVLTKSTAFMVVVPSGELPSEPFHLEALFIGLPVLLLDTQQLFAMEHFSGHKISRYSLGRPLPLSYLSRQCNPLATQAS